jgi:hypothetical protein
MDCPNCGRLLTRLAETLACTDMGTNCPHCWARIRRLTAAPKPIAFTRRARKPQRVAPLRRAA